MKKEYTLAEMQDIAWENSDVNEFDYAHYRGYVYNTQTKMFCKRLKGRELAGHVAVLTSLSDIEPLNISTYDSSGYAARAAIAELSRIWCDYIRDGWPLDYLIDADGLEVSRILSRWFVKLQEELAKREGG